MYNLKNIKKKNIALHLWRNDNNKDRIPTNNKIFFFFASNSFPVMSYGYQADFTQNNVLGEISIIWDHMCSGHNS